MAGRSRTSEEAPSADEAAAPVDLAGYLRALGTPNRLALLRSLQVPRTLGELEVAPFRRDRQRTMTRNLTRQAVEGHLAKLRALGLVRMRTAVREGRQVQEYVLHQARLFVLLEELRHVAFAPPVGGLTQGPETEEPSRDEPLPAEALVAVSGPLEGVAFPLRGPGPWVVGRGAGLAVPLPYDPFVSKENTRLLRDREGGFVVEALPEARNGTRLNWRALAPGEAAPLRAGDTVGVGRSLLVFRGRA